MGAAAKKRAKPTDAQTFEAVVGAAAGQAFIRALMAMVEGLRQDAERRHKETIAAVDKLTVELVRVGDTAQDVFAAVLGKSLDGKTDRPKGNTTKPPTGDEDEGDNSADAQGAQEGHQSHG
jgi:hypothetical protein